MVRGKCLSSRSRVPDWPLLTICLVAAANILALRILPAHIVTRFGPILFAISLCGACVVVGYAWLCRRRRPARVTHLVGGPLDGGSVLTSDNEPLGELYLAASDELPAVYLPSAVDGRKVLRYRPVEAPDPRDH